MKKFVSLLVVGTVLTLVQFAGATPIGYSVTYTDIIPMAKTTWNGSMEIPKFNMPGYELTSVRIDLAGDIVGSAKGENLGSSSDILTMDLRSEITLKRPDGSVLVVTMPVLSTEDSLGSYDGTIDFGGTSGCSYNDIEVSKSESSTFTSAVDMSLFTGSGNITLPVSAAGASTFSGPGSVITNFSTQAGATASITYNYVPVPEPVTIGLLCLGSLSCLIRRR